VVEAWVVVAAAADVEGIVAIQAVGQDMGLAAYMKEACFAVDSLVAWDVRHIVVVEMFEYMKVAEGDLVTGLWDRQSHKRSFAVPAVFVVEEVKGVRSRTGDCCSFEEYAQAHSEEEILVSHSDCS
jgi:hypothetical protein